MACTPMRGGPPGARYTHSYEMNGLGGYSCMFCGVSAPERWVRKKLGLTKPKLKKFTRFEVLQMVESCVETKRGKTYIDMEKLEELLERE